MPVHALINRRCTTPVEVYRTIRDFLAAADGIDNYSTGGGNPGPGYEIVDSRYAGGDPSAPAPGDWCVLRSSGETGTYPHYIHFAFGSAQHAINAYLHWDAAAHTGWGGTSRTANVYCGTAGGDTYVYIYADLDEIHLVIKPNATTNWVWHPCGRLGADRTFYSGEAVQAEAAVSAGSEVTITLPSWPEWAEEGRKIYNWDTSSLTELTISAVDQANLTITVETAAAKTAGSWLAEDLFLYTHGAHNSAASADFYALPTRAAAVAQSVCAWALPAAVPGRDNKYGRRYGCDVWACKGSEIRGSLRNVRMSNLSASEQGAAWIDDEGATWRVHTVYNGQVMAFREA